MIKAILLSLLLPPFIGNEAPVQIESGGSTYLNDGNVGEVSIVSNAWSEIVEYADGMFDINPQSYVYEIREYSDCYHILFASQLDRNESDLRPVFANAILFCEKSGETCQITLFNY